MSLVNEMLRLRAKLDLLLDLIPRGSTIALLDEPVHRNIGDHMIQRGSEAFFHHHGIEIAYRASTWDYASRRARAGIPPDAILVCQGGGHLGDLYPHHQRLREQVIQDFPAQRIVMLPQSIYFRDPAAERRAVAAFAAHPRLHLCLRDQVSFERARAWGCCAIYLAPDMVHALWPIKVPEPGPPPVADTLYLMRRDQERAALPETLRSHSDDFIDWKDLLSPADTARLATLAGGLAAGRCLGRPLPLRGSLSREVDRLLGRAIHLFAPFRQVVTSRLHGALLALLMEKRVTLVDSLTGKGRAYHEAWLTDIEECRLHEDAG